MSQKTPSHIERFGSTLGWFIITPFLVCVAMIMLCYTIVTYPVGFVMRLVGERLSEASKATLEKVGKAVWIIFLGLCAASIFLAIFGGGSNGIGERCIARGPCF